ncbi:hypothetical protein [Acidianus brierleyi]|uniref:Uncharacterized protein n=1 Tax=Acidianus brierleyi TaxID=41673 RepID=A0A2U9IBQ6_9CREN|nr:hypothetical protein [Acidianus brierleyi]AWR93440.1 hypothetical protein DFR85_01275 [Acidianus brierleyi]
MEEFRLKILDVFLSSKIKNYEQIEYEGKSRKDSCAYFTNGFCSRINIKENIVTIWRSENKINPHPVLCFICPFFSIRNENLYSITDLLEIYSYYEKIKNNIVKEIEYIESRLNEFMYNSSSLKRRKEELMYFLNEIEDKLNVTLILIKLSIKQDNNGNI